MQVQGYGWFGKKVLVTGASGFKGSWLAATLAELGASVYGVTRRRVHPLSAFTLLGVKDRIVGVDADVSDRQHVYDLLNTIEPDVIFHLGAVATVPVALRDPRRTYEVNTFGTLNLLEGCRRLQIGGALIVCSTDHVFGDREEIPEHGYKETADVHFSGPYDTSKAAMELIVRSFDRTYANPRNDTLAKLRTAVGITRCANVFGKGDVAFRRVIPNFVESAMRSRQIPLSFRMNGRQFIYVTDAIEGYVRFASKIAGNESRQPCQIGHFAIQKYAGSDRPFIRLESLANEVAAVTGAKVVQKDPGGDWAPNENREQALNCEATNTLLAWAPRRTLTEGLTELPAWFSAAQGHDTASLEKLASRELIRTTELLTSDGAA